MSVKVGDNIRVLVPNGHRLYAVYEEYNGCTGRIVKEVDDLYYPDEKDFGIDFGGHYEEIPVEFLFKV